MDSRELIEEAVRLAVESVRNGWGGPFGALIVKDGEIVARGQNRVLLTGDVTAHAEIEAIRKAVQIVNPYAPTIPEERRNEAHLELVQGPEGLADPAPERARMLMGYDLYATGAPCPMCMGAIYWARLDRVFYSCGVEAADAIGFQRLQPVRGTRQAGGRAPDPDEADSPAARRAGLPRLVGEAGSPLLLIRISAGEPTRPLPL